MLPRLPTSRKGMRNLNFCRAAEVSKNVEKQQQGKVNFGMPMVLYPLNYLVT